MSRRAALLALAEEAEAWFGRELLRNPYPDLLQQYATDIATVDADEFWRLYRRAAIPHGDGRFVALLREARRRRARGEDVTIEGAPDAVIPVAIHSPVHLQNLERRELMRERRKALRRQHMSTEKAAEAEARDRQREQEIDERIARKAAEVAARGGRLLPGESPSSRGTR